MQMYPHWNARDNYRYGQKKKKRKRDKSDDPGRRWRIFVPYSLAHFLFQWHELSRGEQGRYYELAREARVKHNEMHPTWSARNPYLSAFFWTDFKTGYQICLTFGRLRSSFGALPDTLHAAFWRSAGYRK